jgi:hypothetical protein
MTRIATTLSAQQRRIAAQAIAATEARLSVAAPAQLDLAPSVPAAKEVATVTMPMTALTPEILAAAIAQVLGGLGAAPVAPVAPIAPVVAAPKLTAQQKWDAYGADKVVAKVLANGVPVNVHGMFLKRADAIDPKGLIAAYDAAKKGANVAKNATPAAAPASAPSAAPVAPSVGGLTLEQLTNFLKAMGMDLPTSAIAPSVAPAAAAAAPAAGIRAVLVDTGDGWLHCASCDSAYWGSFRPDAELAAKYGKHVAKAHAS